MDKYIESLKLMGTYLHKVTAVSLVVVVYMLVRIVKHLNKSSEKSELIFINYWEESLSLYHIFRKNWKFVAVGYTF